MLKHRVNFVVDGQWGSVSKGLVAGYLADHYKVGLASTNNLPNAGHTVILSDDSKFISKILPCSAFLNVTGQKVKALVGPGAGFNIDQLFHEIEECQLDQSNIKIHPRAMVVTDKHAELERNTEKGTKHIASTMQGAGAVQAEKLMRGPTTKLAKDYPVLHNMICGLGDNLDWHAVIDHALTSDSYWLHEGSQGFSLGVNHGSHYPQCTSRECTVSRELTDLGVSHNRVGDVYLAIRPFPIRVGNVVENGKQLGYSGDCYPDQEELTWAHIKKEAGYPEDYDLHEMTTVTKRLRRVFTFSMHQVKRAAQVNGANKLVLNFANYLDYSCYGTSGNNVKDLPMKVQGFIDRLEHDLGLPVVLVGTGPSIDHVWNLES